MHLVSPPVLLDAKELSLGAAAFFLFVGVLLWVFGWRWHRFWVVFGVTVAAGVVGLGAGKSAGTQMMVVGVLLSVAAGALALEIAKIAAFVSAGTAGWLAAQAVMPQAQELWAVFLCFGLLGVVLYRLWTMLATSFVGVLVSCHGLLLLMDAANAVKAVEFAEKNAAILNGYVVVVTILGVAIQSWTGRAVAKDDPLKDEKKDSKKGK